MGWLEVSVCVRRDAAAAVEEAFETLGASAVTLLDDGDDPVLEPGLGETPLWPTVRVQALFPRGEEPADIADRLAAAGAGRPEAVTLRDVEERDWARVGLDDFRPLRFGRRLWVVPGEASAPDPQAIIVRLDPGLAFGTGTHPTTALCLEWLDAHPPQGRVVLDYGCGSGILAIAALQLGARRVIAVDHDPQALAATLANAERNAVADRLVACRPEDDGGARVDVVLANILAGPLVELAPRLVGRLAPGGDIILSGILAGQVAELEQAYAPQCGPLAAVEREGWARLAGGLR